MSTRFCQMRGKNILRKLGEEKKDMPVSSRFAIGGKRWSVAAFLHVVLAFAYPLLSPDWLVCVFLGIGSLHYGTYDEFPHHGPNQSILFHYILYLDLSRLYIRALSDS